MLALAPICWAEENPLAIGVAGHAFDHLGEIGDQSHAAAASGANIIYATGFGSLGYSGLPPADELKTATAKITNYTRDAKAHGIRLSIGYLCATSIVKLETFDSNWTPEFRKQFSSKPAAWLQCDKDGKPLPSWYGGDYRPACMNNPDWRAYEKTMVRMSLEAGEDGIFFDNPTVHPQGCYCEHCIKKFGAFLKRDDADVTALRKFATDRPRDFMRFRCTIAEDFLGEMRTFARTINPKALITCNNSLNSPEVFFSQCRGYGYNIFEMSKVEDLVVVEDMASQPRVLPDGKFVEYGPVYEMLHAISHGKTVVAVTIADGDYHTPPNLVRLAMAEAAAHGAAYLSWPTWPQNVRQKMIDGIRPQADFLREHADLLNGTTPLVDVTIPLAFEQWVETDDCPTLKIARQLGLENIQFNVELAQSAASPQIPPKDVREIVIQDAPSIRAVVREKSNKTIVHLLNLNVQKLSSFEDRVTPASNVRLRVRCHRDLPTSVKALSADPDATRGAVSFTATRDKGVSVIEMTVPKVCISTILVIE